jgi:ABC-type transporter Mla subunit MlaD
MTRRRVMQRLERGDALAWAVTEALAEHRASLDEVVNVSATLIGWALHQDHRSLDFKLEALTAVMREIRGLLIKNHGSARCEHD